jgi:hypothetical protein
VVIGLNVQSRVIHLPSSPGGIWKACREKSRIAGWFRKEISVGTDDGKEGERS